MRSPCALAAAAAFGALAACGGQPDRPAMAFSDATTSLGLGFVARCGTPAKRDIVEANGVGVGVFDADGDGDLDFLFAQGSTLDDVDAGRGARPQLWLQESGGRLRDASADALPQISGWWTGVAAADADGDGDVDVFVAGYLGTAFLRNDSKDGKAKFTDATRAAGLEDRGWSSGAAWIDADNDGDLDLYLVRYLDLDPRRPPRGSAGPLHLPCEWRGLAVFCGPKGLVPTPDRFFRNRGDGTFEDATIEMGFNGAPASYGLGACPLDFNRDGRADLYVANDSKANFLWRSDGATFAECGFAANAVLGDDGATYAGMGVAADDLDGDGYPEIVVTNYSDEPVSVYRNRRDGTFEIASWSCGIGRYTMSTLKWGVDLADFDLDGDLDVFVANGHVYPQADSPNTGTSYKEANQLFVNDGAGRFTLFEPPAGSPLLEKRSHRALALFDLDDDGDDDLVIVPVDGPAFVLRNEAPRPADGGRARVRVELRAPAPNTEALGATVTLTAGGKKQTRFVRRGGSYASSRDPRLCFGLGDAKAVDSIEVAWPSGARETIPGAGLANHAVRLEPGKGVTAKTPLAGATRP
ncbi:MAG TPA: CRTAC1 family protein [Planctomycetota bacterium]|nr:CRTAC1 family protein [Planctomycetota bacterium]